MTLELYITDTVTNVERRIEHDDESWFADATDFGWAEGNYGCDCNRGLFFARAADEPDPEHVCGMTRYKLRAVENGKVVYDEGGE